MIAVRLLLRLVEHGPQVVGVHRHVGHDRLAAFDRSRRHDSLERHCEHSRSMPVAGRSQRHPDTVLMHAHLVIMRHRPATSARLARGSAPRTTPSRAGSASGVPRTRRRPAAACLRRTRRCRARRTGRGAAGRTRSRRSLVAADPRPVFTHAVGVPAALVTVQGQPGPAATSRETGTARPAEPLEHARDAVQPLAEAPPTPPSPSAHSHSPTSMVRTRR